MSKDINSPMKLSLRRRSFLGASLALAGSIPYVSAGPILFTSPMESDVPPPTESLPPTDPRAIAALVDTLLPADGDAPAATALGVDKLIIESAVGDTDMTNLLRHTAAWLNRAGQRMKGRDFADLEAASREELVAFAEAAPPRSLPQVFFHRLLQDAYRFYYGDPRGGRYLGFEGPPQPQGFMDFEKPPKRA